MNDVPGTRCESKCLRGREGAFDLPGVDGAPAFDGATPLGRGGAVDGVKYDCCGAANLGRFGGVGGAR